MVDPAELAQDLVPHVEAVAALSCRHARVFVGDRHDRFRPDSPWSSQIEATIDVIERLTPRLKDLGIRLAIETHADLTGDELIAILDRLDPAIAGVTLDTGNLVMRLDDPVDAGQPAGSVRARHPRQGRGPGVHPARALLAGPSGRVGDPAAAGHPGRADPPEPGDHAFDRAPSPDLRFADLRPQVAGLFPGPAARIAGGGRPSGRTGREALRRRVAGAPRGRRGDPLGRAATSTGWPARSVFSGRSSRHSRGSEKTNLNELETQAMRRRIVSLDQFRGYTVVGMLFVNFLGGYQVVPAVFKHHNTYCSYADTIMPQFFFAVGFAYRLTFLAPARQRRLSCRPLLAVVKRNLGLILLGFVLYHLDGGVKYWAELREAGHARFSRPGIPARDLPDAGPHRDHVDLDPARDRGRARSSASLFMIASAGLHLWLSSQFYFDWAWKTPVIDGGQLGFLTLGHPDPGRFARVRRRRSRPRRPQAATETGRLVGRLDAVGLRIFVPGR